jgi:predicted dehydrogenase
MSERVKIGMIGCGQIAQKHLEEYAKIPEAEIVAVCDIDEAVVKRTADQFHVPRTYTDYNELLKQDDILAVDVCLHNNYHRPATITALEAKKHVYCEKPIAGSYKDGLAMVEAAKKHDRMLHVQLSTLYSNETRAARELIELGELGELYHARVVTHRRRGRPFVDGYGTKTFVRKENAAGGALIDIGIYQLGQMLHVIGNPKPTRIVGRTYQKVAMDEARRKASGFDVEELGTGFIQFDNGLSMDVFASWAAQAGEIGGSQVLGSKGGVRIHPFGFYSSYGYLDASATIDLDGARFRWDNLTETGKYYASSQKHWVAALQNKVPLLPTAQITLHAALISEGIYLSEKLGREIRTEELL